MDGRNRNNQTAAARRATAQATIRGRKQAGKKRKTKSDALEQAKNVLRRHGKDVFDARIDEGSRAGLMVRVDTRKMSPAAVIEMAAVIVEREKLRNEELRRQAGLEPRKDKR